MRRSAQLDRSHQRTLWASFLVSVLVHGVIFLSTRSAPGVAEPVIDLATPPPTAVPDRPLADPPLELIALRTEPPARPPEPPSAFTAEASAPEPSAATAASGAVAAGSVATHDTDSRPPAPRAVATFEPVPASVLRLAGGETIPALTDLEVLEIPNANTTATGVPIYRRGSVMSAKDEWIAAAGGVDRRGRGVKVVFSTAGGVCPVRPDRGIFRSHTG